MQKMCQWELQWGENHYHHLRRQTGLIHCISNVQVVTAAVHHNKCEVSITSCQVHLGRYNSTVLHSGMYTCACGCYVVAMCMCLFFVTYILEQTQHPLSLVLDGKNSKLIMPCAATGTRGQATVWSCPPPPDGRCTLKCMLAALCCWASTPMYTRIATKDTDIHTDNNTRTSCYVTIYNTPNVLIRCDCS